jgi:type III pantothenate kinase
MILAVDIGNSFTKFGVFDGDQLTTKISIPTSELAGGISREIDAPVRAAVACSVVPEANDRVAELVNAQFGLDVRFVTNDLDFGLTIKYEPLESLGTDRIVNCFAALEKYGAPVIVCSFGTATTIDAVSGDRQFLGGLIAPGFRTMARALELDTAQLREVEVPHAVNVLNQTTETSIQAGVFFSQVGLVEAAVSKMKNEIGSDTTVVATGGSASMIAAGTREIGRVDDNLTLDGLRMLHERFTG